MCSLVGVQDHPEGSRQNISLLPFIAIFVSEFLISIFVHL